MEGINIYSDDTFAENKNFIISTFLWGDPGACISYESIISEIVKKLIKENILQDNFRGFHASELNARNWNRKSKPFKEVLRKLHHYVNIKQLKALIYLESRKKFEANSELMENVLKRTLLDRNSLLGSVYQHIPEEDLVGIYKNAKEIYHYLLHRGKFGRENTGFKYYPDACGRALDFKDKEYFLEIPRTGQVRVGYKEMIRYLINALANSINKPDILKELDWESRPKNQELKEFEPKKDEDSFMIQTTDIISNFFFNTIKYLVGDQSRSTELKANELLGFFQDIKNKIKDDFEIQNDKCVCVNDDLKVSIDFNSDYKNDMKILLP